MFNIGDEVESVYGDKGTVIFILERRGVFHYTVNVSEFQVKEFEALELKMVKPYTPADKPSNPL